MTMGETMSLARQNVVVVHSNEPQSDAETLTKIFRSKFVLEATKSTSTVVLFEETFDPSTNGGIMFIFVPHKDQSSDHPPPKSVDMSRFSGPLALNEQEVQSAVARCNGGSDKVSAFSKQLSLGSGKESVFAVICLPGGGKLLLVTTELLSSTEGRLALATTVTNPEMIQPLENGDVKTSAVETLSDVDLAEPTVNQRSIAFEAENGRSIMKEESQEEELPRFPSLAVSVMEQHGRMKPNFPLNSRVGVPVETELFVGELLLILRPQDPRVDPYYNEQIFSKKKRRLICQIQGKFKYIPKGTVYAGGEISDQMKLGLVGKGLCTIILNLLRSFDPDMHYSFGDSNDVETPHIVFPAWKFFENIVVTKPGETPPPITKPIVEPKASREARKGGKTQADWNTEDTYSMAFYSMYLDLPNWRVTKLPVTKDLDLRTFWGNSFLSIMLYEKAMSREERHIKKENKYIFGLQMKFLGHHAVAEEKEESSENEDILPWDKARPLARSPSLEQLASPQNVETQDSEVYPVGEEYDSDTTRFFDPEEADEAGLSARDDGWFYFDSVQPPEKSSGEMAFMVDLVCPAWVEVCSAKGRYTAAYAFNVKQGSETLFRTTSQFADLFGSAEAAKRAVGRLSSPRVSSSERARRIMGHAFAHALTNGTAETAAKTHRFKLFRSEMDATFLKKPACPARTSRPVLVSGYVARALSEYHWIEEWVQVTDRHISFYQPTKHKPNFRMTLNSIASVRSLGKEESPSFPLYSFLAIETLGRTIYLMFAGEAERNHWETKLVDLKSYLNALASKGVGKSTSSKGSEGRRSLGSDTLLVVDDPTEEFLHKSSLWNCKQRRILNCRTYAFAGTCKSLNPATAVEDALKRALDPMEDSEEGNLMAFLDSAAALKQVNVNDLKDAEKLAFFLNLYHVMIMHAFLVLGTPDSAFKWMSYFNMIAYQCSDDIFSLTELEHNIIRASMNYPSQFISKFVLPKSKYRFALARGDYRINFALNCGSYSNPISVPIYKAEHVEDQLNQASTTYLRRVVEVSRKSNGNGFTVMLPRICQWFADDFGDGSNGDVLRLIVKFLDAKDQNNLLKPLTSGGHKQRLAFVCDLSVKHLPYAFECRHLRLVDDSGELQ